MELSENYQVCEKMNFQTIPCDRSMAWWKVTTWCVALKYNQCYFEGAKLDGFLLGISHQTLLITEQSQDTEFSFLRSSILIWRNIFILILVTVIIQHNSSTDWLLLMLVMMMIVMMDMMTILVTVIIQHSSSTDGELWRLGRCWGSALLCPTSDTHTQPFLPQYICTTHICTTSNS